MEVASQERCAMVSTVRKSVPSLLTQMTLRDLLARYQEAVEVSSRYQESLLRTVRRMQFMGIREVCQLSPDAVNSALSKITLSPVTVGNIRRELLTLWRWAYEEGLTETYPARVRKIKQKHTPPTCWTQEELGRLWDCAKADETLIGGQHRVRRSEVFPAWIAICYDTGMRFGDVHALTAQQIQRGFVVTTASKTGKALVRSLSALAIKEAVRLSKSSPDGTLFRWCLTRRRALLQWRAFLDDHGFNGSSKWLRRCAATAVERMKPGSATAFLQHSAAHLAIRHYIDATQLAAPMSPPPIAAGACRAFGSP